MNWKNIKSFLLILLIAVNIFLAFMVKKQSGASGYSAEALANVTELLEQNGIYAEKNILTLPTKEMEIVTCTVDDKYSSTVSKLFLKEEKDIFTTPTGYSVYGKNGELLKISPSMDIYYSSDGITEGSLTNAEKKDIEDDAVTEILSDILLSNENSDFGFKITSISMSDELYEVTLVQTLSGHPVRNHRLHCIIKDSSIVFASGKWCFLPINEKISEHLLDSVNILFVERAEIGSHKSNTEKHTVEYMEQCYISQTLGKENQLYFMPSWHISWMEDTIPDTFYNALNGEKIKSE